MLAFPFPVLCMYHVLYVPLRHTTTTSDTLGPHPFPFFLSSSRYIFIFPIPHHGSIQPKFRHLPSIPLSRLYLDNTKTLKQRPP